MNNIKCSTQKFCLTCCMGSLKLAEQNDTHKQFAQALGPIYKFIDKILDMFITDEGTYPTVGARLTPYFGHE